MSHWETIGQSDEWYTPPYIFHALNCVFDLDVAAPKDDLTFVPCKDSYHERSLEREWHGFVWCNPPFGGRNGLLPWLAKFFDHRNGIALVPDRTSAPWFQDYARRAEAILFLPKVRFIRPNGEEGKSPSTGTALLAAGAQASAALDRARSLGLLMRP